MYRYRQIFLFTILALLLAACGGASESQDMAFESAPMAAPAMEEAIAYDSGDGGFGTTRDTFATDQTANSAIPQERLIIRTGNLSIVVQDTEATIADITTLAEANGGWVVSSSVFQYSENVKRGEMTIRVPSEGFTSAIDAIKSMSVEVTRESTSGQDVTEEYVDLSSRLGNLEATADRVRGFLEETRNVEEALAVNQELSRLESEIEVIKGRMQFLSESATFSTITIDLTPDELAQPIEVGGWRPQGIARDAIESLVTALQGLASFLIWAIIFLLPMTLLILGPLYLLVRFVLRRRARRATAAPPSQS